MLDALSPLTNMLPSWTFGDKEARKANLRTGGGKGKLKLDAKNKKKYHRKRSAGTVVESSGDEDDSLDEEDDEQDPNRANLSNVNNHGRI